MNFSTQLEQKYELLVKRYPVKRSILVPILLYAQDEYGYLSTDVIGEISQRVGLPVLEVEEVITYYSMLRKKPVGRHHLQICTNISCMLRGGDALYEHARKKLGISHKEVTADGDFSLEEVECIGACSWAPALQDNYDFYHEVTPEKFDALLEQLREGTARPDVPAQPTSEHEVPFLTRRSNDPDPPSLGAHLAKDGYKAIEKALKEMTPEAVVEEMKASNLRGRGGAGFPTGMKWTFVPKQAPKPKYIVCNADESEPGTCKDRLLMQNDPHQVIEGLLLAGYVVDAHQGYIYVRGEYRYLIDILDRAIEEAYSHGYLGKNILGTNFHFELATHTGAGAYECGEESALLESLEGKRGIPRIRPPFPAVVGLYGGPTVLNNVETFASVPAIIRGGGAWYAGLGTPRNGGTRLFCLSGHVNRPGVYELPMGIPLRKVIDEVAGGVLGGKKFKAVIPGGSSTPVLTAEALDTPLDFDSVAKAGSLLGSGGVIVMHEDTCMVKVALRLMQFYAHESCGWCIPCREGTSWLKKTMTRFHSGGGREEDIKLIEDLAKSMLGRTFCPLGDAAAMPTIAFVQKFRSEFEDHLAGRGCRFDPQADAVLLRQ
jgi:NADH-quinone oxidoreductase subunit F